MNKAITIILFIALILSLTACAKEKSSAESSNSIPSSIESSFLFKGLENENAIEWKRPDEWDGSKLQIQLCEFPDMIFERGYYEAPNDYGGFEWNNYVKSTSQNGDDRQMFESWTNIYISDITGDGFSDFAYMVSWTSGLFTSGVVVYDYMNNKHHYLDGYGGANVLSLEDGKIKVTQGYHPDGKTLLPVGELAMSDSKLVITGVKKEDGQFMIPR